MKIKNAYEIKQFGFGEGAEPITMYVASLPASNLTDKAEIYRRTPKRRDGYQRETRDSRLGKGKSGVAGYLLNQMGIFPTSVLMNIRKSDGSVKFTETLSVSKYISIGDLEVPDGPKWFVIDGQHRIEGLKIASREDDSFDEYPVIFTLTNEETLFEMLIFYIVNGRAKSVPTDLAYRILQRMLYDRRAPKWIEEEILTGADKRKAVAAMIVDELNVSTRSPFKGRIQEVGEIHSDEHLTTDGTLTRYVAVILGDTIFSQMLDTDVADLLASFWSAFQDIYPDCFINPGDYVLLKTLGLSSLMRIFPVIYGYAAQTGDVSKKGMLKFVKYLLEETKEHSDPDFKKPISESWWHIVDGPGLVKGTGEGHYKEVSEKLAKKIAMVVRSKKEK